MFLTWGSSESHLLERLKLGFEWQARAGSPLPEPVWPSDALEGHGSSWMIFFFLRYATSWSCLGTELLTEKMFPLFGM